MRARLGAVLLLVLAGIAAIAGKRLLYRQVPPLAPPVTSPATQSYLIALGVGDNTPTVWDGSVTATGTTILSLTGWRFSNTDAISGTSSWTASTRMAPPPPNQTSGPMQENGIIMTVAAPSGPASFAFTTKQGNFTFTPSEVPFGTTRNFLSASVKVMQTGSPFQLTNSIEEEDFPAMAQSGDDVFLAYIQFVHGDRTQAAKLSTTQTITDFTPFNRPVGGDQVFVMHYSKSQRVWTGPFAITATGGDLMRVAVAIDVQGRAWVFYSANRSFPNNATPNFDIYARNVTAGGTMSSEIRLTTDPGTDLFPVAATDNTGRVWVAWQGFRNNNLEILASVENGDAFWPEAVVSTSPASDWDPGIAASSDGQVAVSWDTYDKGDYDVYVRRLHLTDHIGMDTPIPVAATLNFEARSSVAFDPQDRLWIAYEVSGPKWGKDYGSYDTTGIALYYNHTIQVRVLVGNDLYATNDDLSQTLPGGPAAEVFLPSKAPPYLPQPDPNLAINRAPGADVGLSARQDGPKNTFPRLAVDSDGTVYLAFREPAGDGLSTSSAIGQTAGSIWTGAMVYFDGATWHGPGVLVNSDAVADNRPAILPIGPGRLLIAQSTDHRLSPLPNGTPAADSAESDVFALELPVARTQQSPALQRIGQVTPDTPDSSVAAEAAAIALNQSYHPTINGQQYQMLRGDFHRHTELSFDGARDGPLIDSYRYFIDAAQLDWVGCCDHDDGSGREYSWWMIQKFTDAYLLGSKFTPMFYYERSLPYPEGHRNIVFSTRGIRPLPHLPTTQPGSPAVPAPDTNMLYTYLKFFNGLSAPHTSATDQGTDWRNNDPAVEPFVEIYQGARQDYEMAGAPRANTPADSIAGYEAAGYVNNALGKGYQLAFEASSDHVSTHISFTDLWVTSPSRANILAAMKARHMYGSTDDIVGDFRSGTHFMGESFTTTSQPVFTVRLFGTTAFQNVSVIKNGNVVYSPSNTLDRVVSFTWQDTAAQKGTTSYYYVRGLQQALPGQVTGQIVWLSPMWVTQQ